MTTQRTILFDFRSKSLILIFTMLLVAIITRTTIIITIMALLSIYLIVQGQKKAAIRGCSVVVVISGLKYLSMGNGLTVLMPDMFLFIIVRITLMVMAGQPFIGMPPGEAIAIFKKIKAPDFLALPITFLLRFLPTIRSEFSNVYKALRLRGLLSIKRPLRMLEYMLVPVMFRASKVSEELAASAETRGIANPGIHTSRRELLFRRQDILLCILGTVATIGLIIWQGV